MMKRYVQLPMYDFLEVRDATVGMLNRVVDGLRRAGIAVPTSVDGEGRFLLLGQVCGIEVASNPRFPHEIVGAPVYDFDGCEGSTHCAFIVTRDDDERSVPAMRGARAVINEWGSNTGANLFRQTVGAPLDEYFSRVEVSGAHRRSLELVREGEADIASVDCVTYGLLRRSAPEALRGVQIAERTRHVPTPPFVSDLTGDELAVLREVLGAAFDGDDALQLGLVGMKRCEREVYDVIRANH